MLARHLDVRIQAKGTATFSSRVQQTAGHRRLTQGLGEAAQFAVTTVVGGTVSVIGGGKFANGAGQAGFGYLFNHATQLFGERMASDIRSGEYKPDSKVDGFFVEGTKLAVMWTPTGRIYVTGLDVIMAVHGMFNSDYSNVAGFVGGQVHERVGRDVLSTPKAPGVAGRIAAYWGYLVDKVVGSATQSAVQQRQCQPGERC